MLFDHSGHISCGRGANWHRREQWAHEGHGFGTDLKEMEEEMEMQSQCNLNGVKPSFCLALFRNGLTEQKISGMPPLAPFSSGLNVNRYLHTSICYLHRSALTAYPCPVL